MRNVLTGSRALRSVARQWVHNGSTKSDDEKSVSDAPKNSGFSKDVGSAAFCAGSDGVEEFDIVGPAVTGDLCVGRGTIRRILKDQPD